MLEKILVLLEEHDATCNNAKAKYQKVFDEVFSVYAEHIAQNKLAVANEELNDTILESNRRTYKECCKVLDDVLEKANAFIAKPFEPDFLSAIEALRIIENPSKKEIDALIERYRGNYLCYRAICDSIGGVANGYRIVTIDDIAKYCDKLKQILKVGICADSNSYQFKVLVKGHKVKEYDAILTAFFGGDFETVNTALL